MQMELYFEILEKLLQDRDADMMQWKQTMDHAVEMKSDQALQQIKCILQDDSLTDEDCFEKIEQIVCVFEHLGSGCENRYDFV